MVGHKGTVRVRGRGSGNVSPSSVKVGEFPPYVIYERFDQGSRTTETDRRRSSGSVWSHTIL